MPRQTQSLIQNIIWTAMIHTISGTLWVAWSKLGTQAQMLWTFRCSPSENKGKYIIYFGELGFQFFGDDALRSSRNHRTCFVFYAHLRKTSLVWKKGKINVKCTSFWENGIKYFFYLNPKNIYINTRMYCCRSGKLSQSKLWQHAEMINLDTHLSAKLLFINLVWLKL